MRFLLKESGFFNLVKCALTPARISGDQWAAIPWPKRDRWLYVFANRLLWLYAQRNDAMSVTHLPEPLLGQPIPVTWEGRLISQDLANGALEAAAIGRALAGSSPKSILEVGAGYGRTAYILLNLFPDARYTIVDIEPALSISRWYLTQLFDPERLRFATPDDAETLPRGSHDLALSISSLQEMTPEQVQMYLQLFNTVTEGGQVYLKQWKEWHNPVDDVSLDMDDYPIPERWEQLFKEQAPVQTNFLQAAWHIGSPL